MKNVLSQVDNILWNNSSISERILTLYQTKSSIPLYIGCATGVIIGLQECCFTSTKLKKYLQRIFKNMELLIHLWQKFNKSQLILQASETIKRLCKQLWSTSWKKNPTISERVLLMIKWRNLSIKSGILNRDPKNWKGIKKWNLNISNSLIFLPTKQPKSSNLICISFIGQWLCLTKARLSAVKNWSHKFKMNNS